MSKHLIGMIVGALAAVAMVLLTAPAFADHRPGNVVVMGGTLLLTGRLSVPATLGVTNYLRQLVLNAGAVLI